MGSAGGGDASNGSYHTGGPHAISSVAGARRPSDGTRNDDDEGGGRTGDEGERPSQFTRMDICADGKWGGW